MDKAVEKSTAAAAKLIKLPHADRAEESREFRGPILVAGGQIGEEMKRE